MATTSSYPSGKFYSMPSRIPKYSLVLYIKLGEGCNITLPEFPCPWYINFDWMNNVTTNFSQHFGYIGFHCKVWSKFIKRILKVWFASFALQWLLKWGKVLMQIMIVYSCAYGPRMVTTNEYPGFSVCTHVLIGDRVCRVLASHFQHWPIWNWNSKCSWLLSLIIYAILELSF